LTMERLAILKRRFPSTMVRFCTTHLKLRPQSRVMKSWDTTGVIRVAGVRGLCVLTGSMTTSCLGVPCGFRSTLGHTRLSSHFIKNILFPQIRCICRAWDEWVAGRVLWPAEVS
jgi:hypothetical protein